MDMLLSLPILSYLLGPGASSWSTSINLVFFYITWTTLVLSYSPTYIQIVGVAVIRLVFNLLPSLLFLLLDTAVPSLAVNIKLGSESGLPPRDRVLGKLLLLALFNIAAEGLLQAGVSLLFTTALPLLSLSTPALFKTTTPPLPWLIFKQLGLLSLAREVSVYYSHRLLHSGRLPYFGRCHTSSYAHTRSAPPFSLLLFADHPLSVLCLRLLPLYLPALLVRPHLLVFFLFTALVTVEETLAMSGYTSVPGILLRGIARRTAAHYSQGAGANTNYGAWGVLDWLHATTQTSRRKEDSFLQDAVDEVNHQQKKRRTRRT
ncbi:sterol desaturase family [Ophiostoma piceae UAMH 11346]|uniref:Sterol desaturase family n=1 Tax=Ophiostoma piceae (strain UAMH 11346) TaxID=1262450 RepID=S3CR35_OPHP1|nr:sterol desaturase family [Ophiostoma piceae UAMH 11346]